MRVSCTPKGYISAGTFFEYADFFVTWLRRRGSLGGGRRHIILLDGHSSHLYNIDLMNLMKANNIAVASLPPHTTHLLQPLDDVPFANLKKVWNSKLLDKNEGVVGRQLSKEEVMHLFFESWTEAVTPETVKAGFRNTGIWPADSAVAKLKHTTTKFINNKPTACKWLGSMWLGCNLVPLCVGSTIAVQCFRSIFKTFSKLFT
jgi:hypothetical protein